MNSRKGRKKGHKHSEETKLKIGLALSKKVPFNCYFCGKESKDKPSQYKKKKRHFCSRDCYSLFRKHFLPKNEQHAYKNGGMSKELKAVRIKARSCLNHAVRDGRIERLPCIICGDAKSEGHHSNYLKPLDVIWLCDKHHHDEHKKQPELAEQWIY